MEQPPKQIVSIGLILDLLNTPSFFEGKQPTTKAVGDTAKVLIRTIKVGNLIRELDPDEEFLHVCSCSTPGVEGHIWCEIWPARDWRESNARRSKVKEQADSDRTEWNKKSARLKQLQEALTNKGLNQKPGFVEHLADSMYASWKAGKYSEMFQVLKLGELISQFEEEDKQGNK